MSDQYNPIQSKSPLPQQKFSPNFPNFKPQGKNITRLSDQNDYYIKIKNQKNIDPPKFFENKQPIIQDSDELYCKRHSNKRAKYYIKGEGIEKTGEGLFCSKCALVFALEGRKVEKFLKKEEKYRKQTTDDFLSKLKETKTNSKNLTVFLLKRRTDLQNQQLHNNEKIVQLFSEIERVIAFEKAALLAHNQASYNHKIQFVEIKMAETREINNELDKFQADIIQNYEKIVSKMEIDPFIEIMSKYTQKRNSLDTQLSNDLNLICKPISDSIDFSNEIASQISDFIRKNIGKGVFEKKESSFSFEKNNFCDIEENQKEKTIKLETNRNIFDENNKENHGKTILNEKDFRNSPILEHSIKSQELAFKKNKENITKNSENIIKNNDKILKSQENKNIEGLYSSVIHNNTLKKPNNMMLKGFFSGLGKNYMKSVENLTIGQRLIQKKQ